MRYSLPQNFLLFCIFDRKVFSSWCGVAIGIGIVISSRFRFRSKLSHRFFHGLLSGTCAVAVAVTDEAKEEDERKSDGRYDDSS